MSSLECVASVSVPAGTVTGFRRACDILLRQVHVVNRRVLVGKVIPLTGQTDRQDVASLAADVDVDGVSLDEESLVDDNPDGLVVEDENNHATVSNSCGSRTTVGVCTDRPRIKRKHEGTGSDRRGEPSQSENQRACDCNMANEAQQPVHHDSAPSSDPPLLSHSSLDDGTAARLCTHLEIGSVEDLLTCSQLAALCGPGEAASRRMWVRKLIPRQTGAEAEFDLFVSGSSWASVLPLQSPCRLTPGFPTRFEFSSCTVRLMAPPSVKQSGSLKWLQEQVLSKLARWTAELSAASAQRPAARTLQLVDVDRYLSLYQQLKAKYGLQFVDMWPEKTDPLKFVYEDVAIAAYLLLLWADDRAGTDTGPERAKQTFVDIGCGNGLLVHILSSEGHPGYGIDIRSRAIWSHYPPTTRLKVETIAPSADTRYEQVDWLIGNHSDELTPWIPLMAAASAPTTNFFLLPCCPWDFYTKYQRRDTRLSQYEEYMGYVGALAGRCGFVAEYDRLRIPSTRRRCVLGRRRARPVTIDELRAICTAAGGATFTPRAAAPPVRNCSQLEGAAVAAAVRAVARRVSADGALPLPAVAALLGAETLSKLKQQCGGLQTLLRNHAQLFRVRGGQVALQRPDWLRADGVRAELRPLLKTSVCLLDEYVGCPLPAEQCRYAHGEAELRAAPPAAHRANGR